METIGLTKEVVASEQTSNNNDVSKDLEHKVQTHINAMIAANLLNTTEEKEICESLLKGIFTGYTFIGSLIEQQYCDYSINKDVMDYLNSLI